ncbi:GH3 auxin-responsive promoter [Thermoflavifilum aggregans]|uniref:GH3 auxin-responsive promoter n=1 Tax=Thermoflavifilum aggregans TaxID=454188 RepID=A0A2M9CXR6_9BACT|nr:GH3 auxin-responsive promoter family protein [Thermoflavifilum aggregans]PJJ76714.1 GH3 auxin-responsive promoter [Thermoflavifilum aggregans]
MPIIGNLIARSLQIKKQFQIALGTPRTYQLQVLRRLLQKAQFTEFGTAYQFTRILLSPHWVKEYQNTVPIHSYNEMYRRWWHKCLEGCADVTWPGKVPYFALSSGTSESSSKHIPVTRDMLRNIRKVGMKQLYSMVNFNLPAKTFEKGILMLGGTTALNQRGDYYEGDMSGISAKNIPRWFRAFYKPGEKIASKPDWDQRIRLIVRKAPEWDVGTICGIPAWVQIVMQNIVEYHGVQHIHEIWPNLAVYIHGGVSIEPYRESFKRLLGKPITFIETYMASEGSFGFQARPGVRGIKLVLNAGIFFEFIPFTRNHFTEDGELITAYPRTYLVDEVEEGVDYAVVLSTCAGAWRYLIGDVVRFTDVAEHEIIIVGRTKQFLSICGEHLSIDNMNKAIDIVSRKLGICIREFAVTGMKYQNLFAHKWYIGTDDAHVNAEQVKALLDQTLCELNDDYAVERASALKEIFVEILPNELFIGFLRHIGKEGGMNKFPRVLKNEKLAQWEEYLRSQRIPS